jgi:DNA-binding transcriptional regulator YhcF (GntR family)
VTWLPTAVNLVIVQLPGEQIPSVRQIAEEFGISIGTARRAPAVLAEEGLVVTSSWGAFIPE